MIILAEVISPDKLIGGAKQLSELTVTEIWALLALILALAVVYMVRQSVAGAQKATDMRIADATADLKMASAVENLANEIQELRHALPPQPATKGDPHA